LNLPVEPDSSRKTWPVVFTCLVAFACQLIVLSHRNVLILEWRPTELASIALNYYRHGFDFLRPQIFWGGNGSGYVEMEFPLLPYAIAWLFRWFGIRDWVALLPTIACGLALPVVVHNFTRRLYTPSAGFIAGILTATSPTWLAMSTGIWPDPAPVLFAALGVYLLAQWTDQARVAEFLLAGVCLALSILLKLTSLYVAIPVVFLLWIRYRSRWWRTPQVWMFAAIVLVPAALWYVHAYRLFLESHNTFGILAGGYSKFGSLDLYLDPRFYAKTLARVVLFHVTPLGLALAALGAVSKAERPTQQIPLVWCGAVLVYFLVAAQGVFLGHYQYALPIVPPAAALAGAGFDALRRWQRSERLSDVLVSRTVWVPLVALNALAANYVLQTRGMDFRHLSEQKMRTGRALARLTQPNTLIVVVDADMNDRTPQTSMTPPEVFYFSDRRGWYRAMSWLTLEAIEDLHHQGARYLAVSANHMRWFRTRYAKLYEQCNGRYLTIADGDDGIIYDLAASPSVAVRRQ